MLKVIVASTVVATSFISGQARRQESINKPAPLPSQILTAKKVFISNAGGEWPRGNWSGDSVRTYNQFFAAIKNWGKYDIVLAPSDADLVLQISFAEPIADLNVFGPSGGATTGSSTKDPQFRLVLLDPKTNVLLWTFTEHLQPMTGLKKSRDRAFDETLTALVSDLKTLTAQSKATP